MNAQHASPVLPQTAAPEGKTSAAATILAAATVLFAEKSFEGVSIQEIADLAGISKANVFHHYASKEALIEAALQSISLPHAEFAEALLDSPQSSREKIREMVNFDFRTLMQNPHILHILGHHMNRPDRKACCDMAKTIFNRNIAAVIALFQQGQARGEFRDNFPPYLPAMIMGSMTQLIANDHAMLSFFNAADATPPSSRATLNWQHFAEECFNFIAHAVEKSPQP